MKALKDLTNIHGGLVQLKTSPSRHFLHMTSIFDEFSYEENSGPAGVFSKSGFTDQYGTLHTNGYVRIVDLNGGPTFTIDIINSGIFSRDFIVTMS